MDAERLRRLIEAGLSQRAIGRELGLSQTAIRNRLHKMGIVFAPRAKKTAVCMNCRETFEVERHTRGFYCSNACQGTRKTSDLYTRWLKGDPTAITTAAPLRRAVIRRDGYVCVGCAGTVWNGRPIPLELEHKDGNSENNSPGNLCMLCPNCHAQTPTYKVKNRGNGRHKRRQRYAAGQSH